MIIKTLALSSALASCQLQHVRPVMHALAVPVHEHQEPVEKPEKTEPPHGEGSGESPMFSGMAAYGSANVSNTANVTVSSSGSGIDAYTSVAWLPNRFPLIGSSSEFVLIERFEPLPASQATIQIHTETKNHLGNPSARQIQRAVTRRQR